MSKIKNEGRSPGRGDLEGSLKEGGEATNKKFLKVSGPGDEDRVPSTRIKREV